MLVSVYVPTRNRAPLLRKAVESVLTQTYTELEVIVVNDGSSDETFDYLASLQACDSRVRVIHHAVSVGAPRSRNEAIEAARGEFVTGLDDDDRFHPQRIAAFVEYWQLLRRAGERFSCIFSQDVVEQGNAHTPTVKPGALTWESLFYFNGIGSQVFTRRDTLLDVGLFDDELPAWQDLDLFIRVLHRAGPAKLLDAGLYISNADPRSDRISLASKQRILDAYRKVAGKWKDCPQVMRQGLFLQAFGRYYGHKPAARDLISFLRMGVHAQTLKTLAGIYLRRT